MPILAVALRCVALGADAHRRPVLPDVTQGTDGEFPGLL